jgi:outer membrane protein assembly factor BamB
MLLTCQTIFAENWPQWRGPRSNGTSTEKAIATEWSKTKNVAWTCPLPGQGGATPAIWGDKLFVTSADKNDLVLICISAKDGSQLWKKTVTTGNQDARAGEGNSASPSPSTDGKHVWVFYSTGVIACYDFSGNEVWKFDVGERFGKLDIQFGLTSTPVLEGDGLYLQLIHGAMKDNDDTRTGKVIKLDKASGKTVWTVDRITDAAFECKHSYSSPFIYSDTKQKFLVVHGANCTTAHALEDGHEIWRMGGLNGPTEINKTGYDRTFRFVSSPAIAPGTIIIPTCKKGPTLAINVNEQLKGDVTAKKGVVKWNVKETPDVPIPLIVDGLVYNLHTDGRLQCLELETGKEVYFVRTHTVQHRASPVYADGHIYLCGKDGRCTVVKAGREFAIVSSNDLGAPITASPAISDGVLYIRTYEALYSIK